MKKDILKGFLVTFIPGVIIIAIASYIILNMKNEYKNLISQQNTTENSDKEHEDIDSDKTIVDEKSNNSSNKVTDNNINNNVEKKSDNNQGSNGNTGTSGSEVVFQGKVVELRYNSDGTIIVQGEDSNKYQVSHTEGIHQGQTIWIKGVVAGSNAGVTQVDTREIKIIN